MASILYQLATHQEKQDKLYDEIQNILTEDDPLVSYNKLEKMTYLKAVIKETLRFVCLSIFLDFSDRFGGRSEVLIQ